jgi:uncharacterized protein YjbI with pentapeptide repeats
MADDKQVAILRQGATAWNAWRRDHPDARLDLSQAILEEAWEVTSLAGANLYRANLSGANLSHSDLYQATLSEADLCGANLSRASLPMANLANANLSRADLSGADLSHAYLPQANLSHANLSGANLSRADLSEANLSEADLVGTNLSQSLLRMGNLSGANLSEADLSQALLVNTDLERANLTHCRVYGLSVWDVQLDGAVQTNLKITPQDQPDITMDNLEVAQFIYLLLKNQKIRHVIDSITSKAVLILGRFTPERKTVLDALREELRRGGYLPILFDFDPAASQARMETIATLAHLARFVIADISDAKTVLQELQGIVPTRPSLPVQPILLSGQKEPGMFDSFHLYPWFLPTVYYDSPDALIATLKERVIDPADGMAHDLMRRLEEIRQHT